MTAQIFNIRDYQKAPPETLEQMAADILSAALFSSGIDSLVILPPDELNPQESA